MDQNHNEHPHHEHGHDHGHDHGGPAPSQDATEESFSMLALTELAAEKVKEIREAEGIEPDMALRVRVVGGGCSGFTYDLYFDHPMEGDKHLDEHGVKVVVDPMSLMYLMGTKIDYVEGLHGAGFKFLNPNVKATCGCGASFQA